MRRLVLTCALLLPAGAAAAIERISLTVAVEANGRATPLWAEVLERRGNSADSVEAAVELRRPLDAREAAWARRFAALATDIPTRLEVWAALFAPVEGPAAIRVVLGNRGGEDAMTHDATTIAFDLAKLQALYGDAESAENRARLERLFLHEYVHLLQKAWLAQHPQPAASAFERALGEIWSEGLGNLVSMSDRWRSDGGRPSPAAVEALARLEPRFVERLAALACATPTEAARLTADLSNGPFAEKWGALTAALWLEREASLDRRALRRFVQAGTPGVLDLAGRHLSRQSSMLLTAARERSRACAAPND